MNTRAPAAFPSAPADSAAVEAWDRIMELAVAHCLVVSAAGGVAVLATPDAQRGSYQRDRVLRMHMRMEVEAT